VFAESIIHQRYKHIRVIGNWKRSLVFNAIVSGVMIVIGGALFYMNWYPTVVEDEIRGLPTTSFALFYVTVSVIAQQWVYFGYARNRVKEISGNPIIQSVVVSLLYSLIHVYYPDNFGILLATFAVGNVFYYMTYRTNSIVGNIISHSIFGIIAFALNFA
jgi:membrane protease YdiL (CAAX protease family)